MTYQPLCGMCKLPCGFAGQRACAVDHYKNRFVCSEHTLYDIIVPSPYRRWVTVREL